MIFANDTISGRGDVVDSPAGTLCGANRDAKPGHDILQISQPTTTHSRPVLEAEVFITPFPSQSNGQKMCSILDQQGPRVQLNSAHLQ